MSNTTDGATTPITLAWDQLEESPNKGKTARPKIDVGLIVANRGRFLRETMVTLASVVGIGAVSLPSEYLAECGPVPVGYVPPSEERKRLKSGDFAAATAPAEWREKCWHRENGPALTRTAGALQRDLNNADEDFVWKTSASNGHVAFRCVGARADLAPADVEVIDAEDAESAVA